jgi:predicted esterase
MTILIVFMLLNTDSLQKARSEYVRQGMTAYTESNYQLSIDLFKSALDLEPTYSACAYNIACCYSLLGLKDSAMIWLKKTVTLGVYEFDQDSDFDNVRESKEFKTVVEQASHLLEEAKAQEWRSLVSLPEDYDSLQTYPLFIALHGYGGTPFDFKKDMIQSLTEKRYIYVCPYGTEVRGLTSFSWGDVEKCEKKILSEITNIRSKYSVDTTKIVLLGYSQGGYRAFSVGLAHADLFTGIIVVAGGFVEEEVKEYLPLLRTESIKVYMAIGEKDKEERVASNKKAKEILEEHGVPAHLEIFPEVGHAFPGEQEEVVGKAIEFLEEQGR